MKKNLGVFVALALLVAACGGDGGSDPASASTCEELADVSIVLVQDALDSIAGLGIDDMPEDMPEAFVRLEELAVRADELGCTEEEGSRLLCERYDRLTADGEAADVFLESLSGGC